MHTRAHDWTEAAGAGEQDGTWGLLSGCINGFIRLGSVLQFVLMPVVYHRYGLVQALWSSSAIGASGLIFGIFSHYVAARLRRHKVGTCILRGLLETLT
jgi:hypothetical protein